MNPQEKQRVKVTLVFEFEADTAEELMGQVTSLGKSLELEGYRRDPEHSTLTVKINGVEYSEAEIMQRAEKNHATA